MIVPKTPPNETFPAPLLAAPGPELELLAPFPFAVRLVPFVETL